MRLIRGARPETAPITGRAGDASCRGIKTLHLREATSFGLIAHPFGRNRDGRLPKWPTGADCKSAGLRLRWFESITYHHSETPNKTPLLTNVFREFVAIRGLRRLPFSALGVSCLLFQNGAQKAYIKRTTSFAKA